MPLLRPRVVRADLPKPGRVAISAENEDSTFKAIMAWIPVEVIGAYKFVIGLIPLDYSSWRIWLTAIVCVLAPAWIAFATKPDQKDIAWRQVFIAPFAFVCWVVAIQPDIPALLNGDWKPWMGSVVLGVGTLLLPVIDGILKRLGFTQQANNAA
jgi:hypothetical protein